MDQKGFAYASLPNATIALHLLLYLVKVTNFVRADARSHLPHDFSVHTNFQYYG